MTSIVHLDIQTPKDATLRRYGLTKLEWTAIGVRQGWVCKVCHRFPKNGRFVIDHEHVKGWRFLPPAERKLYVRGLLCVFCNHYNLPRGISEERAYSIYLYLKEYNERRRHDHGNGTEAEH